MTMQLTASETEALIRAYLQERGEARACGCDDFPTFAEWNGESSPRETAEARYHGLAERDELDLY
jgi:hypothetical protein